MLLGPFLHSAGITQISNKLVNESETSRNCIFHKSSHLTFHKIEIKENCWRYKKQNLKSNNFGKMKNNALWLVPWMHLCRTVWCITFFSVLCLEGQALILSFLHHSHLSFSLKRWQVSRGFAPLSQSDSLTHLWEHLWRLVSGLEKGSSYFSPEGDAGGWPCVMWWPPPHPPFILCLC